MYHKIRSLFICIFCVTVLHEQVNVFVYSIRPRVEDKYSIFVFTNGTIQSYPSYSYLYTALQVHDLLINNKSPLSQAENHFMKVILDSLNTTKSNSSQLMNDTQSVGNHFADELIQFVPAIDELISQTSVKLPEAKPHPPPPSSQPPPLPPPPHSKPIYDYGLFGHLFARPPKLAQF